MHWMKIGIGKMKLEIGKMKFGKKCNKMQRLSKTMRTNKVNGTSRRMPEMKRVVIAFVRIAIFVYVYFHTQEPYFSLQLIKERNTKVDINNIKGKQYQTE